MSDHRADGNPLGEPVFDTLGVRLTDWRPGFAAFQLVVEPRHLNYAGRLHGGVIATLLDVACGYSGMASVSDQSAGRVATVMLAVSYHAGVAEGAVTATGRVTGGGRTIYFASAELVDAGGALIASAQGSFRRASPTA